MAFVSMIGPPNYDELLEMLAAAMRDAGHDALRIRGAGYAADPRWAETEIALAMPCPVTAADLAAAPRLRGIVTPGIGVETIDLAAATAQNVAVVNGRVDEHSESMAEATLMLMLAVLYDLPRTIANMADNRTINRPNRTATMAAGKTVGVIGHGSIAKALIRRLPGLDMDVLVSTRTVPADAPPGRFLPLEEMLPRADVIVVLASLNPETRHLLDDRTFALARPGAILVNTSRGGLIDEAALLRALDSGQIARAALDVFETEPLPFDSPLRAHSKLLLTPHAVGLTRESGLAIPRKAVQNMIDLAEGRLPQALCNTDVAGRWPRA